MAEPVVSLVLEKITKLMIEEKKFLSGVSDEAEKLRSELQLMQMFLRDADQKQNYEARVKVCVSQCRDLAYEAENVLEDYAFQLSSRRGKHGIPSMIKRYAFIINDYLNRHSVRLEIRGLNIRISDLTQRFQNYGIIKVLHRGEESSARPQQSRVTYSYVANDEDIVGIEGDIQKVHEIIAKDDFGVVTISGMGGCGKTTLARKVYNHPGVKSHFDSFAWVCVSQQWETRKILQGILMSFLPHKRNEIQHWSIDEMVAKLVRLQEEKKCLLVLDDIWTTEVWECIKIAFPHNKKGLKILITTRNRDVAMHIGPGGFHYQPGLLNDDESLELLLKKAFRNTDPEWEHIEILKDLGRKMVRTCRGLPLAVVVLGGILSSKRTPTEWNEVDRNIRIQQEYIGLQGILFLSYNDLPYKLKLCFLYLSILCEDKRIDARRLYNLWIAEGMVSAEDRIGADESIIEVAGRFLGELAKRCIVMVEEMGDDQSDESYPSCYLHDMMLDFCRAKAREENFLKVLDKAFGYDDMELMGNSFSMIPRVMINSMSWENEPNCNPVQMEFCRSLRALGFRATHSMDLILYLKQLGIDKFTMLRSLIIEGLIDQEVEKIKDQVNIMPFRGFKLPIGKLIHLRQLSVRRSKLFLSPASVSNLEHLEILDLYGSRIIWTKKDAIRTRRLKYLCLPEDGNVGNDHTLTIYVSNDVEVMSGGFPNASLRVKKFD